MDTFSFIKPVSTNFLVLLASIGGLDGYQLWMAVGTSALVVFSIIGVIIFRMRESKLERENQEYFEQFSSGTLDLKSKQQTEKKKGINPWGKGHKPY